MSTTRTKARGTEVYTRIYLNTDMCVYVGACAITFAMERNTYDKYLLMGGLRQTLSENRQGQTSRYAASAVKPSSK